MRTRDLRPGVVYATCEGQPVEPLPDTEGVIHAHWRRHVSKGASNWDSIQDVSTPSGKGTPEDAWSGCIKAKPLAGYFTGDKGLRVMCYAYDREGNLTEEEESVVDPRDLKGTWEDFKTLHLDVIEMRYDLRVKKWLDAEFKWQMERLNADILPLGATIEVGSQYAGEGKYQTVATLTFSVRDRQYDSRSEATPEEKWETIKSVLRDVERFDVAMLRTETHLLRAGAEVS